MKKHEKMITESVIHILGFMVQEFIKACFLIALDDELSDLKGMIEPGSLCDTESEKRGSLEVELELLLCLDDPHIKGMMQSIESISIAKYNLQLINKMEFTDSDHNEKAIELANKSFNRFFPLRRAPRIRAKRTMIRMLPQHYQKCYHTLWACSEQLLRNRVGILKTTKEDYERVNSLIPFSELESDSKNVNLVYTLLTELQQSERLLPKKVKK